jgi:pSer/pThr/pTyr-binding forkhead associated (FHA) protein
MAFIEHGGQRHPIPAGEVLVGSGEDCPVRLPVPGVAPHHAILTTARDLSVTIRLADPAQFVEVNGARLGALPQPLLHGDKIALGPVELLFADERESGSTKYIAAVKLEDLAPRGTKPGAPDRPVGTTGGRIVCLIDGREYQISGAALRFGREAGADVVVPGNQVSRRHAEIVTTPRGYVLVDTSTNGSFVNGERVEHQRLLARGDIITIGDEEFRFYADAAKPAPGPAAEAPPRPDVPASAAPPAARTPPAQAPPAAGVLKPATPPASGAAPPPASASQLQTTAYFDSPPRSGGPPAPPVPAAPVTSPPAAAPSPAHASASRAALAKFVVRSGALKGQRLMVKVPIVNIGRADYCDIVLPDDSVSSQHAKLTRREGVWVLTDLGSTNGTLVDGEPVHGDIPIAPGAFVRFGDVQLVFDPTDDEADINAPKATRMIPAVKLPDLNKPSGPSR